MSLDSLLKQAFELAPTPFVLLDRQLVIVWMNQAYLDATMRDRQSLVGRHLYDAFPADPDSVSHKLLDASFRKVLDTGKPDHLPLIPYAIAGPEGSMEDRYWSATHTPILDEDGNTGFILQQTSDLTALHAAYGGSSEVSPQQTSELLERAEAIVNQNLELGVQFQFLRNVFEQAPSYVAIYRGPDHRVELVNSAYRQTIGNRDIVGQPLAEALPEIIEQGYIDLLDNVYQTGETVTLKASAVALTLPDGEERTVYVDLIFRPLLDADGAVNGIFVQGMDVTEQLKAETAARESEQRFRQLAQRMPNHIWTATPDGALDWVNDQVLQFTGRALDDVVGENWLTVLHPEDQDRAVAAWTHSVETGDPYEIEFRISRHDGTWRWFLIRASALRNVRGEIERWVGANTDIDERYQAQRALAELNAHLEERVEARSQALQRTQEELRQSQKMESIGNLAGGIAHDFNNILQVITGSLQLIERDLPENPRMERLIDQARAAVSRGKTLSSQVLSFSRRQPLEPRPLSPADLLTNCRDMVRSAVGDGVVVKFRVPENIWNILADPGNVENALLNLAINARDAMDGHGELTIEASNHRLENGDDRLGRKMRPGEYVELKVVDTGCGIPDDMIDKVLEPFVTSKENGKGTGLGLSTVYGFVRQSGGDLVIDSEPGRGTAVSLFLPRTTEAVEALPLETPALGRRGGHETVLVVEDDPVVRDIAVDSLRQLGYKVLEANNADHARPIVEGGEPIDLLFTDVVMPGRMKSTELAKLAQANGHTRVLYASGYSDDAIVHDGRLDPGVNLLSKPYEQDELARKVREILDSGPAARPAPDAAPAEGGSTQSAPPTPADRNGPQGLQGLKVMVCEDDAIIALNIEYALQDAGCEVRVAHTGEEALEMLRDARSDILVSDLGLPGISGIELARRAREAYPDLALVFATGQNRVEGIETMDRALALTKPFTDDMLVDAIRDLVATPAPANA
ncbi:hybrid sensor histidine kinase/response regulator [Maricaulis sp. CAU 1757]